MKKTISINIAGLIFYIEEDGYDKLRQYIGSVHRYFSTFADSTEIVADIEGRIAERFLLKQKTENKQAISVEDVEELIRAMGNISDFEAAEHAEDLISEPLHTTRKKEEEKAPVGPGATPVRPRGKFFRDLKRKILGGVAAGIAHYYAMDPLWVRLLLLIGIFGMVPFSGIFNLNLEENFALLSGFLLISYIAMWIAFPGSTTLEDNTKVKKFYRDPERKVLGGVASGLSSYFNVDTGVIRFIWVISIFFFGTGLLAYIILWAIAPAANTITEKMEMQGEPITLFNIDSNIKRNLEGSSTDRGQSSDIRKLLLLPFTIIGKILNVLGKIFRELGPLVRVLAGIIMVGIAAMSLLSLVVLGAAFLGLASVPDIGPFPSEFLILKDMPLILIISVAALLIVPVLVVLFLGLMLLLKRRVVGMTAWIVLAGVFIFSLVGAISSGVVFQRNFSETADYVQQRNFSIGKKMLLLDGEGSYSSHQVRVSAMLKGTVRKDSVSVKETYFAQGAGLSEARQLASQINYAVEKNDSALFLPAGPLKSETLPYRNQRIEVTLEVPYHHPFAITRKFYFAFLDRDRNTWRNMNGFDLGHRDLNWESLQWAIVPDSGLVCLNMPEKFRRAEEERERPVDRWEDNDTFRGIELGNRGEFVKQFAVPEFRGVDFAGAYYVLLKKGEQTTVTVDGSEANVEALGVKVEEGILRLEKLDKNADLPEPKKRIGVVITTPDLEFVELSGAGVLKAEGFNDLKQLAIKLSGASMTEFYLNSEKIDLDLTGVSKMLLKGRIGDLKASISGTCLLEASESHIRNAEVRASGMSKVVLGTVENLDKRETGASRVSRRGE